MFVFDLKNFRHSDTRVYTKEQASFAITVSRIHEMSIFCRAVVIIPPDTISVNPSFFENFFRYTIERFGQCWFRENILIDNQSGCDVSDNLQLALDRIARKSILPVEKKQTWINF